MKKQWPYDVRLSELIVVALFLLLIVLTAILSNEPPSNASEPQSSS